MEGGGELHTDSESAYYIQQFQTPTNEQREQEVTENN